MRKILILRHGIVVNRYVMLPAERYFRRRGYEVHNRTYRSTRKFIAEHARDLAEELRGIEAKLRSDGEPYEFYAVAHSMGGLILRYALTHCEMPLIRRAVLIASPNQGSATARYFKGFPPFRWIFGTKAAKELAGDPPGIFGEAGVPEKVEIGILAGDARWKLYPVRLPRPHDAILSVSEALLPPFPHKVLPYGHTPILFVRYTWEEAAHFLEHGRFRE